jgi:hypothetical protein
MGVNMKRTKRGFGAKTASEQKRDELGKKAPTSETVWESRKLADRLDARRHMIDVAAKYDRSKTVTSKFDRRFAVSPLQARTQGVVRQGAGDGSSEDRPKTDAVAPESHASKDGLQPVPQSVAENNGAASPEVDVSDVRGGAGRPAGEFSPGKDPALDLRDREMSSVAYYVRDINGNWQRCVDAFINVGRLCAEANARLTAAEKSELMPNLPFEEATFSKFVRIGTDTRLHAPDIKRLLPAHYTTTYAISLLKDEELKQAIAENVIHPDMKRDHLQKWRNSHREKFVVAPSPKEAASDSAVVGLPIDSTQDAVNSGALPAMSDDSQDNEEELAALPDDAPAPEAVATAAEVARPPALPLSDEDIPAFLDRRPLSPEDQRAFDVIKVAWERHLQPLWRTASVVVRERIIAEVIRANASGYVPGRGEARSGRPAQAPQTEEGVGPLDNLPF